MAYIDIDYITERLSTADLNRIGSKGGGGVMDAAYVQIYLDDANNFVDGYLSGVYVTPISNPPDLLLQCAFDVFYFLLYSSKLHEDIPKGISKRYDNAVSILSDMQRGMFLHKATKVGGEGARVPGSVVTNKIGKSMYFTDDVLKRMP